MFSRSTTTTTTTTSIAFTYMAIRRYRRVFCLRFKQYVQNYMHTPRNTQIDVARARYALVLWRILSLSLWLRMNAFWSISHFTYNIWHMLVLCMYGTCNFKPYCTGVHCAGACACANTVPRLFVFECNSVCVSVRMHMHQLIAYRRTSISTTKTTEQATTIPKKIHPHRNTCPTNEFTKWMWNAMAVEVNFTCSFSGNVCVCIEKWKRDPLFACANFPCLLFLDYVCFYGWQSLNIFRICAIVLLVYN